MLTKYLHIVLNPRKINALYGLQASTKPISVSNTFSCTTCTTENGKDKTNDETNIT